MAALCWQILGCTCQSFQELVKGGSWGSEEELRECKLIQKFSSQALQHVREVCLV